MKLLPKNEIRTKIASERKLEIDQGVALARKVDKLRETASAEEARLELFRSGTVGEVLVGMAEAIAELDQIYKDIDEARLVHAELRKPLTEAWEQVAAYAADLELRDDEVTGRETAIKQRETACTEREAAALVKEQRNEADEVRVAELTRDAERTFADANDLMSRNNASVEEVSSRLSKRERNVALREAEVQRRETDNENRIRNLEARETAVNDEARRLEDLYDTLERTKQRKNG